MTDLAELAQVMALIRDRAQAELSVLLGVETQLRDRLGDLDRAQRQARDQAMRSFGDPLLVPSYQAFLHWSQSARAALNADLARALAEKERAKTQLARAESRCAAMDEHCQTAATEHRRQAERARLAAMIDQACLGPVRSE